MLRLVRPAALLIGAALLLPAAAEAAPRFVAPGGSDAGDCSAAACAGLAYAYGRSLPGDTIVVAGGTYGPQALPAGEKAVTVAAATGAQPDLAQLRSDAANVTVRGLRMRSLRITGGSRSVFDGIAVDGRFAKQLALEHSGGTDITVRNSTVGNVTDEKGAVIGEGRFTLDNVTFHDVLVTHPSVHNECVYATGAEGLTVRNSRFYNCATMDLFFTNWAGGPDYGNVTLENNVFEHSMMDTPGDWHYYSLNVGQTGPGGGTLTNWVVRNNTFEIDALVSRTASTGSRWVGNLGGWTCVPGVEYRHNVGSRCGATDKAVNPDSSTRTSTAPFGWVNPAAHDFRLQAGSPAIDAADPSDAPPADKDGYPRVGRPDAGAHEFGSGPPSGPALGAPPPAPSAKALRFRSARLAPGTICRRGCARVAKLRVQLPDPARLTVTVARVRGTKTHTVRRLVRRVTTRRTIEIRARGLARGRYRVTAVAVADGDRTTRRSLKLRIR